MDYFNNRVIQSILDSDFMSNKSFPWISIKGIFTNAAFATLYRDFPSLDLFNYHEDVYRGSGQRPHDRYYASYEFSRYKKLDEKANRGIIHYADLESSWQEFVKELRDNTTYHQLVRQVLNTDNFGFHLVWHMGVKGNEVSAHRDAQEKLGTHLLYFNTSEDWSSEWGGDFLVLDDLQKEVHNPEFEDFKTVTTAPIVDNHSLIFKNTPKAWHGVKPLNCPEGFYRRLANVVFYPNH